jgi:hypothetical protein
MPLPERDSKLRRLPPALNERQSIYLDGIRYAIEMADIAYSRLAQNLLAYSIHSDTSPKKLTQHADLFLDAWSFVDSVHRLREIAMQMPITKKNAPGLVAFLNSTKHAEEMRHIGQHLRRELDAIEQRHQPVHGILSWIYVIDIERRLFRSCSAWPGKLRNQALGRFPIPNNRSFRANIDHIELWIKDLEFSLSDAFEEVKAFTRRLENSLPPDWAEMECLGTDTMIALDIQVTPEASEIGGAINGLTAAPSDHH